MRRKKEQSQIPNEADVRQPDSLSIHRSFLLRLYPGSDLDAAEISGRVEHVVSGETKEFRSVTELLLSIGQLLRRPEQ
jgi:hypothetical protein